MKQEVEPPPRDSTSDVLEVLEFARSLDDVAYGPVCLWAGLTAAIAEGYPKESIMDVVSKSFDSLAVAQREYARGLN